MYIINGLVGLGIISFLLWKKKLGIYPIFLALYCLVYILVPALMANDTFDSFAVGGWVKVLGHFKRLEQYSLYANIVVLIGLIVIAVISIYKPREVKSTGLIKADVLYRASLWGIGIAVISFGIVVLFEGGLIRLFETAQLRRAGYIQLQTGVLLHFAKLILPSSIVLFAAILDGISTRYALWFGSLVLSLVLLYILAGRATFAVYLISYIYLFVLKTRSVRVGYVFVGLLFGFLVIQYGEAAFNLFIYEETLAKRTQSILQGGLLFVIYDTLVQFTFPYTNILLAMEQVRGVGDLHLLELPKAFVNNLPGGTFGIPSLKTLSDFNTGLYRTKGEIPVDMLTFGYYSFHILGVVFTMSFWCWLFRFMDHQMLKYRDYTSVALHSVIACKLSFVAIYADLHQFVSGNTYLFLFAFLMLICKVLKRIGD